MKLPLMNMACIAACGVFTLMGSAVGAQTFAFSYTGPGIAASGILNTSALIPAVTGESLITSLTGTRNGSAMTLTPGNPDGTVISPTIGIEPFAWNDVLYYPGTPALDLYGLQFTSNGMAYNIYTDPNFYAGYLEVDQNQNLVKLTSFTVTAVPEPGSIALVVGMSLSGAVFLPRRKQTRKTI